MKAPPLTRPATADRFCHEALLHAGDAEFVEAAMSFVEEGLQRGEDVLVVVSTPKVELLRDALGAGVARVLLADMADLGRNPGRIISVWDRLLAAGTPAGRDGRGRGVRGIGEPVWPGRTAAELDECHRHESLLNLAFARRSNFWLVCPYDTAALDPAVVDHAWRTHPILHRDGERRVSDSYQVLDATGWVLDGTLAEPGGRAEGLEEIAIGPNRLAEVRARAGARAAAAGFDRARVQDTMLAVSELVANTMRHGGGHGALRIWREGTTLVAEVRDAGVVRDPLAGRLPPRPSQLGGRGLWLVNEVCDLVQLRSSASGTVVRVHVRAR